MDSGHYGAVMKITIQVSDEKWAWLEAKCKAGGVEPSEPLLCAAHIVDGYLDACGRDMKASLEARLAEKLALMSEAEKEAFIGR